MKLMSDRLQVEDIPEEEKTKGGIIIPTNPVSGQVGYNRNYRVGKVINTGKGRLAQNGELIPVTVNIGDVVLYPHMVGKEVEEDGKPYLILFETDVWAVLELEEKEGD